MKVNPKYFLIFWALLILLLCNMKISGVPDSPLFFDGFDKLVHAGLFFVLGFLLCFVFFKTSKRSWWKEHAGWVSVVATILYGGIIELLQGFVFTYRSADWWDWLFDSMGALLGLVFFNLIKKYYLQGHAR